MIKQLKISILLLVIMTALTGLVYPLVILGLAQIFFPYQANGSMLVKGGQVLGSELIGQAFDDPAYFWGRLSATAAFPYNATSSGGSNASTLNPGLVKAVQSRVEALRAADPSNEQPIPADLVTASASGLDPHISLAAARYQAGRVARQRKLPQAQVEALINRYTEPRLLGFIGENRVNVLMLNLALDEIQ